jgi:hypothetical protein
VDQQLEQVAEQIASIDELQGGFDAIGFSQGAILHFLWYIETVFCIAQTLSCALWLSLMLT